MTLAAWVARAGRARPGSPAVGLGGETVLTYGALADRVARLAGGLRDRLGLAAGERVALAMANVPAYAEVLFGIWHAGLSAVPMNAKLHQSEFRHILEDSGARVCLATEGLAATVAEAGADGLDHVIAAGSADYEALVAGAPRDLEIVAPDALAWLFYTSGTTGRPKGAMLTHRNLTAMTLNYFADFDRIGPGDTILHAAPLSHGSGLWMLPHVAAGAVNVMPESGGFDADEIYSLIARWPRVSMFAAPTMVRRLTVHPGGGDTANLKLVTYGGGPMYVEDAVAALDRFGPRLAQLYGQGESPMTITHLSPEDHAARDHPSWRDRLASVGVADSVVQVRVVDGDGRPLGPGEKGEVAVFGDTVMAGYWRNAEATARTLRDGWLLTGDVGHLDEDGYLTLTDRSKDVIISGGTNIYPREVEEVLLAAPGVAEVSVIGRPHADWGEIVVAYVVAEPGATPHEGMLDRLCLERMARFKRPKRYRFVDALPKNNYGKVLKTALREMEAAREDSPAAAP
ncbi:AMP-binding protein [Kaustia mangrovi]|uniref:3-methylmercaptopropionyl-CoA ligase n=1 Tax=Kaustia mangrovi TaxID=2593653 RepID=A0A7S8HC65_9HYPH|nr:AMP-binding protein [Kaustia mangrovi]QPC43305.1 AMP-binding protein [Kaustia mangrovi]